MLDIFIIAVRAVCSSCSFAGKRMIRKCKLQQLQDAMGIGYCSFSYSPLLIFLIILFVVRLTKEYITERSESPTSFPA